MGAVESVKDAVGDKRRASGQLQHALIALYIIASAEHVHLTAREVSELTGAERSYCSRVWRASAPAVKAGADIATEIHVGAAAFIDRWLPKQRTGRVEHGRLLAAIRRATKLAKTTTIPASLFDITAGEVMTLFGALHTDNDMAPDQVAAVALVERARHYVQPHTTVQ